MDTNRSRARSGGKALLLVIALALLASACMTQISGKFRAEEGVPKFIKVGQTTRTEVFDKLGEPYIHRFVADKETAVYGSDRIDVMFAYGTYEGHELVIRFENKVVSDARIEKTGSGWGCLMSPVYTLPLHPAP